MKAPTQIEVPKLLLSEWILMVLTFLIITFDASESYTGHVNKCALLFIGVNFLQLGTRGYLSYKLFKFILPMFLFCVLMWLTLLINFDGFGRVETTTKTFILFASVYALVRFTSRMWAIEIGVYIGILWIWFAQGSGFATEKTFDGQRFFYVLAGDKNGLNPNVYGFYLSLSILFSVKFFLLKSNFKKQGYLWVLHAILAMGVSIVAIQQIIFATGSRKAMIIVLVVLIGAYCVFSIGNQRNRTLGRKLGRKLFGGWILAGVLLILFLTVESSDYSNRFKNSFEIIRYGDTSEKSATSRLEMVNIGLHLWFQSPIWGNGPGGFNKLSNYNTYAHSNFVELLCNSGICGILLYYRIHIKTMFLCKKWLVLRNIQIKKFSAWYLTGMFSVCLVFDLFAVSYYSKITALILGMFFGLISNLGRRIGDPSC